VIQQLTILSNRKIAKGATELVCRLPKRQEIAPGRFMHLKVGPLLRRPISIADAGDDEITFLFKEVGKGTNELSGLQPGMVLDALGPLGNGFPVESIDGADHVLLVGGGIGVPPLYYAMRKLVERGVRCSAVLGFDTRESVFYEDAFRALGRTSITTVDGTAGTKGFVTAAIETEGVDVLFACGPEAMLRSVQHLDIKERYISIENRMGCGIGACFACVCESPSGYVKTCTDGPVFRAEEVIL